MNWFKPLLFWFGIVIFLALLISLPRFLQGRGGDAAEVEQVSQRVPVQWVVVERELFEETLQATGTILSEESIEIRAEESGRLVEVHLPEGQWVEEGTLLARLNDAPWQAQKRQIEGEIRLLELQVERARELRATRSIPQDELDRVLTDREVLQGRLEEIEARIDRYRIEAPFSGMLGFRQVSVGQMISPDTMLSTLQKTDSVRIEFALPERFLAQIREGSTIHFTIPGNGDDFTGEVFALDGSVDRTTRTILIRARTDNPDRLLRPGSLARVRIPVAMEENAILIPSTAVIPGLQESRVYVVDDGVARQRVVQTGRRTGDRVSIRSGLEEGDKVITLGVQSVSDGREVEEAEDL